MSDNRTQYIEIDSTFRNRVLWPKAAHFQVDFSTSEKGIVQARDPLSLSSPIENFRWRGQNMIANVVPSPVLTATVATAAIPVSNILDNVEQVIVAPAGSLHRENEYYRGLIALNTTTGDRRRIILYRYLGEDGLGNDRAVIIVSPGYSSISPGDTLEIADTTDLTNPSALLMFIPGGGDNDNEYGSTFILYNETRNDWRKITDYGADSRIAFVNTDTPVVGWLESDRYLLRIRPPLIFGAIVGATINSIQLPLTAAPIDDIYKGSFIRMTSGTEDNAMRRITAYDGATRTATVYPSFDAIPLVGDTFEVMPFTYDNAVSFSYSGSMLSLQTEQCYEIQLVNLLLPNKILATGFGSRVAFYPYVYVKFRNVTGATSGYNRVLFSNNRFATDALFRATVDDISRPESTNWVKLNGDGMVQTIKFKPTDVIEFSVYLPNGDLYETQEIEYYSPQLPNLINQISACFAIRKI